VGQLAGVREATQNDTEVSPFMDGCHFSTVG
jgi:hypothetical protein